MISAVVVASLLNAVASQKHIETQPLVLLPQEYAKGGRCLDGSMPGYYYGTPSSGSSSLWHIFLEGGGGCTTKEKCIKWGKMKGSSNKWAKTRQAGVDPDFEDAHRIFVPYCTGDVHSGQVVEPTDAQWGNYFSGHLNFKHIMEHIFKTVPDAPKMKRVLFAGNSAGGFGVFLNCDFLQDFLADQGTSATVKCAPNAGWFEPGFTEDHADPDATPSDWASWSSGKPSPYGPDSTPTAIWQTYFPSNCVAARGNESWKCSSVHVAYPYIKAPVFVLENQYDTNQILVQKLLPIDQESTSMGQEYIAYYGRAMRNSTNMVVHHPFGKKGDGLFLPSCFDHGATGKIKLSGVTGQAATNDWFFGRGQIPHVLIDDCEMPSPGLPCNPTCDRIPTPSPPPSPTPTPSPPPSPTPKDDCEATLRSLCGDHMASKTECRECAAQHGVELATHGCTGKKVKSICPSAVVV